MSYITRPIVSIRKTISLEYPEAPFSPKEIFQEFKGFTPFSLSNDEKNEVDEAVRDLLMDLELDRGNIGTDKWNPFREVISPGQRVVIKPNLVRHTHPLGPEGVRSMISHAAVIRPIIDYLLLAAGNNIHITICDVPLQQTVWEEMIVLNGLKALVEFYQSEGIRIELLDLRYEISYANKEGIIERRSRKVRDPLGYTAVNLGKRSALMPIIKHYERFEITDYGTGTVPKHHNPEKNEYFIPNTVLQADLFINVPKLKTHKKTGLTFNLKNLIGINGDKSWLAHHRSGSIALGGDEFGEFKLFSWLKSHIWAYLKRYREGIFLARLVKRIHTFLFVKQNSAQKKIFEVDKVPIVEGSWYGNDTVWRCIKDLNNIVLFADKQGVLQDTLQRQYLCIGDGIVAGDKEGPMRNRPKPLGIIMGGFNPVYVDYAAASLMGFDYQKIPQIRESFINEYWPTTPFQPHQVVWKSNIDDVQHVSYAFEPPVNWRGHIEKEIKI